MKKIWAWSGIVVLLAFLGVLGKSLSSNPETLWIRERRKWEEQGIVFDFSAFVGPRPPDRKNVFAVPMVRAWISDFGNGQAAEDQGLREKEKEIDQLSLLGEILILMPRNFLLRFENFHDILRSLREAEWIIFSKKEKKWVLFYKGKRLYLQTNTPPICIFKKILSNERILEELAVAFRCPKAWMPIHKNSLAGDRLYWINEKLRSAARLFFIQGLIDLRAGKREEARDCILTILNIARIGPSLPCLYSKETETQALELALQLLWEGLARRIWKEEDCTIFAERLAQIDFLKESIRYFRGDLAYRATVWESVPPDEMLIPWYRSMSTQSLRKGYAEALRLYTSFVPKALLSSIDLQKRRVFFERVREESNWFLRDRIPKTLPPRFFLLLQKIPLLRLRRVSPREVGIFLFENWLDSCRLDETVELEVALRFAETAVALERYRLFYGKYPDSLQVLIPRFLSSLPINPRMGTPIRYFVSPDRDQFVLDAPGPKYQLPPKWQEVWTEWQRRAVFGVLHFKEAFWLGLDLLWAYPETEEKQASQEPEAK